MKQPKGGSEKGHLKALGRKDWKSALRTPPKEEGQLETFWGETSKGKYSEKIRKGPATNVANTTFVLVPRVANGGNQWYTQKTLERYYKRGWSHQQKTIQQ